MASSWESFNSAKNPFPPSSINRKRFISLQNIFSRHNAKSGDEIFEIDLSDESKTDFNVWTLERASMNPRNSDILCFFFINWRHQWRKVFFMLNFKAREKHSSNDDLYSPPFETFFGKYIANFRLDLKLHFFHSYQLAKRAQRFRTKSSVSLESYPHQDARKKVKISTLCF